MQPQVIQPQALPQIDAGQWNRFRPLALSTQSKLSERAQTVYGWIAALYAFSVPWSDMLLLPYKVQFTRPLIGMVMLSWLLSWRANNTVRRIPFPVCAMLLFVSLVPAHFLTADDPTRTGRRLLSYLGLVLVVLFFQQAVRSQPAYYLILRLFVAGCAIPLAGLAWNFINGVVQGDGRYSAPGYDPNDLAGQIAFSIPIASYLGFHLTRRARWFRLYLPFAVAGVLLTASRAGLVVLVLVSLYPALLLVRKTKRGKLGLLVAIVLTASAVYYVAPSVSFGRLATMGQEVARGDMNGRGAIWTNGLELFWENPVFGIGAGAFSGSVSGQFNTVAHNTYLGVLVEHGIIGFVVFLAIIAGLLMRVCRFPSEERLLWLVILGSWMVFVTTLSWENREFTWLIWALCVSFTAPASKLASTRAGGALRAA